MQLQATSTLPDIATTPDARSASGWGRSLTALVLLGPAVIFFLVVFVIPVGLMVRYSFLQQMADGSLGSDFTLVNYTRLATATLYQKVVLTTLRISLYTTLAAAVLAYPLALVIARGPAMNTGRLGLRRLPPRHPAAQHSGSGCRLHTGIFPDCQLFLPALLGGNFTKMLGTLVEEQILSVFDWPFGAAISTVMVIIVLLINVLYMALIERRFRSRASEGL